MELADLTISRTVATLIFCAACLAGYRYRQVWKAEGPRHLYWIYGAIAAIGLAVLAFIPLGAPG